MVYTVQRNQIDSMATIEMVLPGCITMVHTEESIGFNGLSQSVSTIELYHNDILQIVIFLNCKSRFVVVSS